jgi:hypothetical protein
MQTVASHIAATGEKRKPRYYPAPVARRAPVSFVTMPAEPDDAHMTGVTRSLSRRLLGLNVRQES